MAFQSHPDLSRSTIIGADTLGECVRLIASRGRWNPDDAVAVAATESHCILAVQVGWYVYRDQCSVGLDVGRDLRADGGNYFAIITNDCKSIDRLEKISALLARRLDDLESRKRVTSAFNPSMASAPLRFVATDTTGRIITETTGKTGRGACFVRVCKHVGLDPMQLAFCESAPDVWLLYAADGRPHKTLIATVREVVDDRLVEALKQDGAAPVSKDPKGQRKRQDAATVSAPRDDGFFMLTVPVILATVVVLTAMLTNLALIILGFGVVIVTVAWPVLRKVGVLLPRRLIARASGSRKGR